MTRPQHLILIFGTDSMPQQLPSPGQAFYARHAAFSPLAISIAAGKSDMSSKAKATNCGKVRV
jgi:hypothetical protein